MLVTSLKICTGGFFFLLGATTLVESWPSQQFLSIWGNLGLVLSIFWVSSFSGRSCHRLTVGTWVFLLFFLWMVSICVFSLQYQFQAFYLCVQTNSIFGLSLLFIPLNNQNFFKKIPIQSIIKMSLIFHFELQFCISLKKLYSYYYAAEILFIFHLISYFRLTAMFRPCPVCKSWNACSIMNCLKLAATKTCSRNSET